MGIRYYDTAPLYGYSSAEQRLGRMLQSRDPSEFVISTKVGRLMLPPRRSWRTPSRPRLAGRLGDRRRARRRAGDALNDWYYRGVPDVRPVYDYSYDGVMRSVESSLERTGLDRLDILWIHDPDTHWEQAHRRRLSRRSRSSASRASCRPSGPA